MSEPITLKRGDVGILFVDNLKTTDPDDPETKIPLDLTGLNFILFLLKNTKTKVLAVSAQAAMNDAPTAAVSYQTIVGDLDVAAKYHQEWEVHYLSGQIVTVPSDGYNDVVVEPDLNPPA